MSFDPSATAAQLSLAGFEAPQPTDRLFFAVMPDATTAAQIVELAQHLRTSLNLRGRVRPTSHFHVTLHHLGDYVGLPANELAQARAAAAGIAVHGFEVVFDHVVSFKAKRNLPLVLRGQDRELAALIQLQQTLGQRMAACGLGRRVEQSFLPHLTLLYDDRAVDAQPIEPLRWRVDELLLVHSLLGRTEHRVLGRWPLP
ncbi:MAG: 2'-5' RNA ligase family protein [Dyella sp.]